MKHVRTWLFFSVFVLPPLGAPEAFSSEPKAQGCVSRWSSAHHIDIDKGRRSKKKATYLPTFF
jgi:hypothetical protein